MGFEKNGEWGIGRGREGWGGGRAIEEEEEEEKKEKKRREKNKLDIESHALFIRDLDRIRLTLHRPRASYTYRSHISSRDG